MTRELLPWEIAVSDLLQPPGSSLDLGLVMEAMAALSSLERIGTQAAVRYPRYAKPRVENPATKRAKKSQRAARKARRRGEAR